MGYKKIAIIFNQPLDQVQGINYVNSSFIEGNEYFHKNNIELTYIFSQNCSYNCVGQNCLTTIGTNVNTVDYKRERRVRTFLKKVFDSKYLLGATLKLYFNHIRSAKKAVNNYRKCNEKFDYVIFQDLFSAAYYINKVDENTKTIIILHSGDHELEQLKPSFYGIFKHKYLGEKIEKYLHAVLYGVDKVVYLSKYATTVSPLPAEKKTYIFNGKADISNHSVEPVSKPINIVIVGSVIFRKGQHLVIEALSSLSKKYQDSLHLHIIGAGSELEFCKQMVSNKKIEDSVTFWGNRNDVPEVLKKMDVLILASDSEGMPMSIIEALRQGLYIVGTRVAGVPEMINSSFGILVERNVNSIASAIMNIVDNNLVTIESKENARKFYEDHFSLEKMINSYSHVLNSL